MFLTLISYFLVHFASTCFSVSCVCVFIRLLSSFPTLSGVFVLCESPSVPRRIIQVVCFLCSVFPLRFLVLGPLLQLCFCFVSLYHLKAFSTTAAVWVYTLFHEPWMWVHVLPVTELHFGNKNGRVGKVSKSCDLETVSCVLSEERERCR